MRKIYIVALASMMAAQASAQWLSVRSGCTDYLFPALKTGVMNFNNGKSLSVMGKSLYMDDIDRIDVVGNDSKTDNTVTARYDSDHRDIWIEPRQTAGDGLKLDCETNRDLLEKEIGGFCLSFQLDGIDSLEIESVDALPLGGNMDESIITVKSADGTFLPGKQYYIPTFPCDIYGGYRLSIFRYGLKASFFGVHQNINAGDFISPVDLVESDLEFDDPDAPLVEDERPELDKKTKDALVAYQKNKTEENKNALMEQMGIKYDKVVARKKAKLRELEREAKEYSKVEEMQKIVDEMVENRESRLEQQFWRLVDPREDDNPDDQWLVLRGSSAKNAYIAYAPVTNEEYKAYKSDFNYAAGEERLPVVNISLYEAEEYCHWLSSADNIHEYRLPSEEEWILAAGHMPKDVEMNSNHVEKGLTSVDAYAQTTGACGGIDFWGNCWEWTTTTDSQGRYIVKGGSWDSSRDSCRSEYSDDSRDATGSYPNVGFRVVRVDR